MGPRDPAEVRAEGVARGSVVAASGAEALAHSICLQAASGADTLSQQTNGLQAASGASFLWRAVLRPRAPGWVVWTAPLVRSVPLTKKDRLLLRRCCQLMLLLQLLRLLQLLPRAAAPVVAAAPPAAPAAVLLQPLSPAAVAVASPPPPRKNLNATLGKTKHDPRETKHGHRKNESRP